jgi:ParB family chromosome partitioning protein
MVDESGRRRLGRGLATLIGDVDPVQSGHATGTVVERRPDRSVAIELLSANPNNPRQRFSDEELDDLAASVRKHGIMQPILVRTRPHGAGEAARFEIIAGERRWRAAQRAELDSVPVIIRNVDDRVALELAIVENVQRSDLNPVEEASGYQQLIAQHDYTQNDLAEVIGKSRSHVANTLRLLKLPTDVLAMVADGALSAGHARTLVNSDDPQGLAQRIVEDGLSVRQAEKLAQQPQSAPVTARSSKAAQTRDADTLALEKSLGDVLGLAVHVDHRENGNGSLTIKYKSLEQLDDLCRRLL